MKWLRTGMNADHHKFLLRETVANFSAQIFVFLRSENFVLLLRRFVALLLLCCYGCLALP
jgi:hypothetical protein